VTVGPLGQQGVRPGQPRRALAAAGRRWKVLEGAGRERAAYHLSTDQSS